ncbi:histidine kinase [Bacteroides caccae]|jgi:hypothetical protein|uniref:histidine kinase n=1 Tax=Bacteroides caccae TaxID=47678 RepID=UPI0021666177|nr:histidine kinase [Bacteroides caccae]MCS2366468.1 histidine kinase [Bacteroides caccae]MCS3190905.1 histidine kinase [Bacteroides caccae]
MKLDKKQREELLGTFIFGVVGLLIMLLAGCAASKNIDRDTQVDYSNNLQQMQNRMDSLLYNMKLMQRETSDRLSNLKIENTTTYLSVPDSTGKQYPTVISETKANKEEKENKTTDTKIEATMQRFIMEVNDLKQQLNTSIIDKEKVKEVSWWQLHKVDVYAVLFALIIVIWLVRSRKK